jgi:hypothetical protein
MITSTSQQPNQIVAPNIGNLRLFKETSTHECWQQITMMTLMKFFGDNNLFKPLQLPKTFLLCKIHTIPNKIKRFRVWVGMYIKVLQFIKGMVMNGYKINTY